MPADGRSSCTECELRGNRCVGQDFDGVQEQLYSAKRNVRDRVGRLEAMVETLMEKVESQNHPEDEHQQSAARVLESMAVGALTPSSEASVDHVGHLENAPLLSLFDNTVLSRKQDPQEDLDEVSSESPQSMTQASMLDSVGGPMRGRHEKTRQALLAIFPPERELKAILDATGCWWKVWERLCPFYVGTVRCGSIKEFVASATANGHPIQLARVLICIAVSLQQLPADECEKLRLPLPTEDLLGRYMDTVRRLVTSQDESLIDLDGLDCLMLQAKLHLNIGQPRQSWLLTQRAMALGQLLGLHRKALRPASVDDSALSRRQRYLWWDLYQCDQFLSLLLGLPYSARDQLLESSWGVPPEHGPEYSRHYRNRLAVISGRITDLTQRLEPPTLAAMDEVDKELDRLVASTPEGWWETDPVRTCETAAYFERIMTQLWHLHIKLMLHLPFMLRSATDSRYAYSKRVCLSAARAMIKRYGLLRMEATGASYYCKILDFEAFTATVILLLELLGGDHTPSSAAAAAESAETSEQADWDDVDRMIGLLRLSARQPGSVVALQSLKVLETLRTGRDRGSDFHDGKSVKLVVPFLGTITIGRASKGRQSRRQDRPNPPTLPTPETEKTLSPSTWTTSPLENLAPEPFISFSSLLPPPLSGTEPLLGAPLGATEDGMLPGAVNFDLDQDWNWFVNDPSLLQLRPGGV